MVLCLHESSMRAQQYVGKSQSCMVVFLWGQAEEIDAVRLQEQATAVRAEDTMGLQQPRTTTTGAFEDTP